MGKQVLVITGSPRKNGNSAILAEEFIRGAEEAGASAVRFDAAFAHLSGCTACDHCWHDGKQACVIADDFQRLQKELEKAEVIAFAYPLYWSTMPAQLKNAVDRLYSYCSAQCKADIHGKKTVLLLVCECEGDENFALVRKVHESLNGYLQWESAGEVAIHTCFEAGKVRETDGPARAYALGWEIVSGT